MVPIKQIITHPLFRKLPENNLINDVALVELETPLDMTNPNLGTICLPEQDDKYDAYVGSNATTAGWGLLEYFGMESKVLNKVNLPVVSMDYCSKQYNLTNDINSMLCTYKEHYGVCQVSVLRFCIKPLSVFITMIYL